LPLHARISRQRLNRSPVTADKGKTRRQLIKDLFFPPKVVETPITTPTAQQIPDNDQPTSILTEKTRALYDRDSLSNFRKFQNIFAAVTGIALITSKIRPQQSIQLNSYDLNEEQINAMPVYAERVGRTIFERSGAISRSNEVQNRRPTRESTPPRNQSENQSIGRQRHSRPADEGRQSGIPEQPLARRMWEKAHAKQGTVPPGYTDIDDMSEADINAALDAVAEIKGRKNNPQQQ
jgi:hypothetical protein